MSTANVIKQADIARSNRSIAFNFDDMAHQAGKYLDQVRAQAAEIIAQAQRDAQRIRQEARQAGQADFQQQIQEEVGRRLESFSPTIQQVITQFRETRHAWLRHWEASAVQVAARMAAHVCRQELSRHPAISVELVREALELAAGSGQVRVFLSPQDHHHVSAHLSQLSTQFAGLASVEWLPDPQLPPGGCRLETMFGTIDQSFDAQLARIVEELNSP